jgi:hypothetical protein
MVFFSDNFVASFFESAHGHQSAKFILLKGGLKRVPDSFGCFSKSQLLVLEEKSLFLDRH